MFPARMLNIFIFLLIIKVFSSYTLPRLIRTASPSLFGAPLTAEELTSLVIERSVARRNKRYDEADRIKSLLVGHSVDVEDFFDGNFSSSWRYSKPQFVATQVTTESGSYSDLLRLAHESYRLLRTGVMDSTKIATEAKKLIEQEYFGNSLLRVASSKNMLVSTYTSFLLTHTTMSL